MKLRNRLSLYSVSIFSIIILAVSTIVYFTFYSTMEKKEMKALESKAVLAGIYYLEQDELTSTEHDNIKSKLLKTISRWPIIFDSLLSLLFLLPILPVFLMFPCQLYDHSYPFPTHFLPISYPFPLPFPDPIPLIPYKVHYIVLH